MTVKISPTAAPQKNLANPKGSFRNMDSTANCPVPWEIILVFVFLPFLSLKFRMPFIKTLKGFELRSALRAFIS